MKRILALLLALLLLTGCSTSATEENTITTSAQTVTEAEVSTVPETESPTEVSTEAPNEAPTDAPTEAPTEPKETEKPDNTESATYKDVNETVYATTDVNVRSGAGTSYSKLGRISKGTAITRTGIGDNGWSRVVYNGKTAYISTKYLTTEKPTIETEPTETEPTETEHKHDYKSTVVAPTCTAKGYTLHECKNCSDSYKDSETAALGHDWDNGKVTKKATCTEDGVKTYTCERSGCGKTKTEAIAKTGHKYETTTVAPTTEAKGYDLHTCSVCGHSYKDNYTDKLPAETEPPHQHSYTSKITKAATCTEDGVKTFSCSCGESYTETIAKTGHSYSDKVTAPTCTAKGYTTHTCGNCGHSYKDTETAALGHSWGDWVRTKEPTTEAEGQDTRTCSNCGATETRAVDKLPEETEPDEPTAEDYLADSHYSDEAITYINEYRAANGLPALRVDHSDFVLLRAAELRVSFSHTRPNGGYIYEDGWASECIAGGYSSAKSVVDAWYNSTGGHKETMLNASYTVACVAYNGSYWVLLVA